MRHVLLAAGLLAALFLAPRVRAETVILVDGSSVQGQVRVLNGRVTIVSREATLTLPASKVLRIEMASAPAAAPAPKARQPAAAAAAASTPAPAARPVAGAPASLTAALAQKIDVDFEAVTPAEVFDYLRQITDINLVVDKDVRVDTQPVTLRLRGVSVAGVLDLVGELNGYAYDTRPGEILFVRMKTAGTGYVVRIYPVTDLLLSTEDTGGGFGQGTTGGGLGQGTGRSGGLGAGAGSRSSNRNQGLSPQYTVPAPGTPTVTRTAPAGGQVGRAQGLIMLMQGTCGGVGWAQPVVAGR